jgi:hypothetical protein
VPSAERLDGAVIDINLRSQMSYLMADVLEERDVPFVALCCPSPQSGSEDGSNPGL